MIKGKTMRSLDLQIFVAVTIICACSTAFSFESAEKQPFQAVDIFDLKFALYPEVSASGKWVTYTKFSSDILTDESQYKLWVTSTDGAETFEVSPQFDYAGEAAWAPRLEKFAYVASGDGPPELRLYDAGHRKSSTLAEVDIGFPQGMSWSPDGRYIAFTAFQSSPALSFGVMPEVPEGAEWHEAPTIIDRLSYRYADGSFKGRGSASIFIFDIETKEIRKASNSSSFRVSIGSSIVWTADASQLIAQGQGQEIADDDRNEYEINLYRIDLANGVVTPITNKSSYEGQAAISPDGSLVAYIGYHKDYPGNSEQRQNRLYLLELDTGVSELISGSLDRMVEGPRWSPDGSGVYVTYDDRGVTKLAKFAHDGSYELISENLGTHYLAYTIAPSYTVADNGVIIQNHKAPGVAGELVMKQPGENNLTRITNLNDELFSDRSIAQTREINFVTDYDQTSIQGWYILPPNHDPSKKYPLLLEIHGGPYANYGPRFDIEKQLYAAAGYVVLYINPRGSTSYGTKFVEGIYHNYPGNDLYDLRAGVDAIMDEVLIDRSQMYIVGGSGGGILTGAMIAEYPTLFRAAAVHYPISNWRSYVYSAAPWIEVIETFFDTVPWSDDTEWESRSIMATVDRVITPTMVMVGERDYQAPVPQAEAFYRALKWNDVDAVLVVVPDETHGIRDHPSHFAAKMTTIIGWLQAHR